MVSGDEIIEDGGDHPHPQEVPQLARPSQAARDPVYNMDGREVGRPYAYRDDVGAVGILTGNWGGGPAKVPGADAGTGEVCRDCSWLLLRLSRCPLVQDNSKAEFLSEKELDMLGLCSTRHLDLAAEVLEALYP